MADNPEAANSFGGGGIDWDTQMMMMITITPQCSGCGGRYQSQTRPQKETEEIEIVE